MNIRFNLQPWRATRREYLKKKFITITVSLVLLCIFVLGFNYYLENQYIEVQEEAIQVLQNNIAPLQKAKGEIDKIKKMNIELDKQIVVIQALQKYRKRIISTLDAISLAVPDTVFLNSLSLDNSSITVSGVAKTEKNVADFMRNIGKIKDLDEPVLRSIETAKTTDRYSVPSDTKVKSFVVTMKFKDVEGQ